MRVLVVDNNIDRDCWGAQDLARFGSLPSLSASGVSIYVRRGPQRDLPNDLRPFDKIILSGSRTSALDNSPWVQDLETLVRRFVDLGRPLLGVCYGHQILARAFGGEDAVRKAVEPEFGWTEIEILEESLLFRGLPRKFHSFSSHFEEVAKLPQNMKRLAKSRACDIQAIQLEGKPVFGIQFHPEKEIEDVEKILKERIEQGTPNKLLHPKESKKYYDPKSSELIFRNFLSL